MTAEHVKEYFYERDLRKVLECLSDTRLNELILAQIEWFGDYYSDEPTIMAEANAAMNGADRDAKLHFILSADPIYAEGGLIDFLLDHGVL